MRIHFRSTLILAAMTLALQSYPQSAAGQTLPQLTQAQCDKLHADLVTYEAFVLAKFGNTRVVRGLIALAEADFKKLCPTVTPPPPPPYDNHFSADTSVECSVLDSTRMAVVSLGVNSAFNLVNVSAPFKTACMTSNACFSLVTQKFSVFSASPTARCSDPVDQTVYHMPDSEVQTKINALP